MNSSTKKLVTAAMLAALTCVATMLIVIPSPLKGYLNLGDCLVLTAGWILPPSYSFLAAGVGSALADLFSGYALYAPATFLIKGLMAWIAYHSFHLLRKQHSPLLCRIISGAAAELMMVLGYFIFEGFLYGFLPSAVNIPANSMQGLAGLIIGTALTKTLEQSKIAPK